MAWEDWHLAEVMHHLRRGMRRVMGESMGPEWEHTSIEDREAMMAEVDKGSPLINAVKRSMPDAPPVVEPEEPASAEEAKDESKDG